MYYLTELARHIVRIADIDWIETAGNYVRIHTAGTAHLYRDSLRNFESRLDAARFVRIHARSS